MTIRQPNFDDIEQIMQLNKKYLFTNLTETGKQNGFIRIEYDRDDLQQIITNKEIIIATNNEIVIGYYLIGKKSGKAALNYQRNQANSLFDTNQILFNKIGYGCQVCINDTNRNNGLFVQMLNALTNIIKDKYTHLLCSISDDNIISMKTHLNNGWQIIDTFETTKIFIYKTHKSNID